MRRAFFSVVLLVSALLIAPASPATAAPYCGIVWGSLAKTAPDLSQAPVVNVRTGRHACYDRLVVDVAGDVGGYTVAYVPHVVQDGSGYEIPTRGGAALQITVNDPSYDSRLNETYHPANPLELYRRSGYSTFRQVVSAGSFEGYTSLGLGVRARLPSRRVHARRPGDGVASGGGCRAPLVIRPAAPEHRRGGLRGDAVVGAPGDDDVARPRQQVRQRLGRPGSAPARLPAPVSTRVGTETAAIAGVGAASSVVMVAS